jgi:PAS domain S-box-containing protein/diguanylate cyclase (GGDEF)-like protein
MEFRDFTVAEALEPVDLRVTGDAVEAKEMLRALTAHTPYGIFRSNAEGGCEYVNPRWCELSGLSLEETLGDGWKQALHPEDVDRVLAEWGEASRIGRDSVVEYRFLRPDGASVWIEGYATALRDRDGALTGWVGTCLDLTARKQVDQELQVANEELRAAFENAPIGIALLTLDGRWFKVNRALCALLGRAEEELLRSSVLEVTYPEDIAKTRDHWGDKIPGSADVQKFEKRYQRPNGETVYACVNSTPIRDPAGNPMYIVAQIEDITERKNFERELTRLAECDSLTGLANRRKLTADLENAFAPTSEPIYRLLALFDLNGFKHYNDTFGHPAGDQLLVRLADRLSVATNGCAYRMGGDEFCVLAEVGPSSVEELLEAAMEALHDDTGEFTVSSSFGSVLLPFDARDPERALSLADERLYAHKKRNQATRFSLRRARASSGRRRRIRDVDELKLVKPSEPEEPHAEAG